MSFVCFSQYWKDIKYTDYKKAHSLERLVDINDVNIKEYKNIGELENERSKLSYQMSDDDKIFYDNKARVNQILEKRRQKALKLKDRQISDTFRDINKGLIGN